MIGGLYHTDETARTHSELEDATEASLKSNPASTDADGLSQDTLFLDPLGLKIGEQHVVSNIGPLEWTEVEVTSDSGACETVIPAGWCPNIPTVDSLGPMRGDEYEVANGPAIRNAGEK